MSRRRHRRQSQSFNARRRYGNSLDEHERYYYECFGGAPHGRWRRYMTRIKQRELFNRWAVSPGTFTVPEARESLGVFPTLPNEFIAQDIINFLKRPTPTRVVYSEEQIHAICDALRSCGVVLIDKVHDETLFEVLPDDFPRTPPSDC